MKSLTIATHWLALVGTHSFPRSVFEWCTRLLSAGLFAGRDFEAISSNDHPGWQPRLVLLRISRSVSFVYQSGCILFCIEGK